MSKKLWGGGFSQTASVKREEFWNSIGFDQRLAKFDIQGSMAHARMLGACGIVPEDDVAKIIGGLTSILDDLNSGNLEFRLEDEDIHMNIERTLTEKIGPVAGKLHTARSRNDQVVLDMHLYVRHEAEEISTLLRELAKAFLKQAAQNIATIMPGYTHLQRAQPVTFAHHLLAYVWMFVRDMERIKSVQKSVSFSPLGAGALAGTTFPIDRDYVAQELGFDGIYQNSLDAVSNRDFILELLSANAIIAAHLSRFCEEVILWVSSEFSFVKLSDAYCTGSSMMPQKKNADLAELVRGKTGRVYGALTTMLTVIKGLPLAYNKDFQEDKECLFDSVDTIKGCLYHLTGMVETMSAKPESMLAATKQGFLNATDFADYLVGKGLPFREAHEISARLVAQCLEQGRTLEDLSLDEWTSIHPLIGGDVLDAINIRNVLDRRQSQGGPAPVRVKEQIEILSKLLG
ncbi:MAG TPA: argininosuccinate lyase [Alphaproteobacteria bacterium]|nr:argininosuccinate lyase [Alphaproteobacteria bacterium]HOO52016.1 argininosuccinate lyase [Alphaproteobacteria bacterium]